jgi:hypothetical protein
VIVDRLTPTGSVRRHSGLAQLRRDACIAGFDEFAEQSVRASLI